jgi:hypothetical protein
VTGGGGGGATDLEGLSDVDLTSPANDDFLQMKGGLFVNRSIAQIQSDLGITTEQLQDLIGAMVTGGTETNITVTYDDTNARFDFVVPTEDIQDIVGAMVSGNTESGITVTYNDGTGKLDFSVSGGGGGVTEAKDLVFNDTPTRLGTKPDAQHAITALQAHLKRHIYNHQRETRGIHGVRDFTKLAEKVPRGRSKGSGTTHMQVPGMGISSIST